MKKYKKRILMFPLLFSPLLITPLVATSCTYLDELCERMHVNFLNVSDDIPLTKNNKGVDEYLFINESNLLTDNQYFADYYSSTPPKPGLEEYSNKILKILNIGNFKLVYGSDSENILFYENENPIDFSDLKINYDIKKMTNNIAFYALDKNGNKRLVQSNMFKFEDYAKDINCKIEVTIQRKMINNKSIISTTLNYIFTLKDSKKNWKWWYTRNPISLKMISKEQEKVILLKRGINQKLQLDDKKEIWLIADAYNDFIRGTNANNVNTIGKFIQWLEGSPTIDSTNNETVLSGLEKLNNNVKKIFKDIVKCIKSDIWQTNFIVNKDDLTFEYLNLQSDTVPIVYPLKKINLSLTKIEKINDNEMKIFFSFKKSGGVSWNGTEQEFLQDVNIEIALKVVFGENNKGNINFD